MPDITKCRGDFCSVRETCKRFTAKRDPVYQPMVTPDKQGPECTLFWPQSKPLKKRVPAKL